MRAILTYHSVDETGSVISIDERTFRRHVAWLAKGHVRTQKSKDQNQNQNDGASTNRTVA